MCRCTYHNVVSTKTMYRCDVYCYSRNQPINVEIVRDHTCFYRLSGFESGYQEPHTCPVGLLRQHSVDGPGTQLMGLAQTPCGPTKSNWKRRRLAEYQQVVLGLPVL